MPTYEYACTACDDRFEVVQSFTDAALTECRECGGRLRKVFSPVGVVFKGSGFYKTDSRSSSSASSSSSTSPAAETKSDGKSESKPETKPAPDKGGSSSTTPAAAAS